ncbi:MAG: hypothetical protein GY862_00845 [Gammaproteobacteria bacterium]|nr:hypothetical protein [Gammaproteobacteria bacterium]
MQNFYPAVPQPDVFIELALAVPGVEKVVFNMDGTFDALYQKGRVRLLPVFEAVIGTAPGIVLNADGSLTYTVLLDREAISVKVEIVVPAK